MKKVLLLILLLGTLIIAGCSTEEQKDYHIYEGLVVDKIFDKGYTYTTPICSGKVCTTVIHRVPDKYYLIIYKEEKIDKHRVSKEFYDTFTIGSYVTIGEEQIVEERE